MENTFKSLSFDVLEKNSKYFLDLAKSYFEKFQQESKWELTKKSEAIDSILEPIKESLKNLDDKTSQMERFRESSFSSLKTQIEGLIKSENLLKEETTNLSKALKSPNVRGSWGQIHLKRVVELSGMSNKCDFFEQVTVQNEEKIHRPDMVIRLPGKRCIVIDAKTPLDAYLRAMEEGDEELKKVKMKLHVDHLRKHIRGLGNKEYWKQFPYSPEYVILFLPSEAFFSHALVEDPEILEHGAHQRVIIASPTTLIAILRAVAYVWEQDHVSKNTEEIIKLGKEFYDRLIVMNSYWQKVGKNLSAAVDSYNNAITSFETRVLASAKKLKSLGNEQEFVQTPISKKLKKNLTKD